MSFLLPHAMIFITFHSFVDNILTILHSTVITRTAGRTWMDKLDDFLEQCGTNKLAVVTSGGTTVNLEKNTVRFIDNFSRVSELVYDRSVV